MQPKAMFGAAGEGGGEMFLRGLFDKIQAEPQIAKRSDYKSAADMYMEKSMTPADREQMTALMQSWYDTRDGRRGRRPQARRAKALAAAFEASPQFAEDAEKAGLIDRIGYDDDALGRRAMTRAGNGAKSVPMRRFRHVAKDGGEFGDGPRIALIAGLGRNRRRHGRRQRAVRRRQCDRRRRRSRAPSARRRDDKSIKAILLRVDLPGGSVSASDQILDAVKKAQAAGKPVVVSMGCGCGVRRLLHLASADEDRRRTRHDDRFDRRADRQGLDRQVARPDRRRRRGGRRRQERAVSISALRPTRPTNGRRSIARPTSIYADFTQKVAKGRKLPLDKVQEIAKGRVWTGADASARGLVDELGGFWTAADVAKKLAGIPARREGRLQALPAREVVLRGGQRGLQRELGIGARDAGTGHAHEHAGGARGGQHRAGTAARRRRVAGDEPAALGVPDPAHREG